MKSRLDFLRTPILSDVWSIFDGFLIDFWCVFFEVFGLEYYIDYQIGYSKEYIEHIKIYLQHGQLGGGNAACRAEDNGSAISIPHLLIVDLLHIADTDESYGTYVKDDYQS